MAILEGRISKVVQENNGRLVTSNSLTFTLSISNPANIVLTVTLLPCWASALKCQTFLGGKCPHHISAESETCLPPAKIPQRLIERSRNEQMDASDKLKNSGIVVLGNIDATLVEKVRTYAQTSTTKRSRYQRQTELEWNGDCSAVLEYFEKVSWQRPGWTSSSF